MNRRPALLGSGLCMLLLAACGNAERAIPASATLTAHQAAAAAKTINLTSADLPTSRPVAGQSAWDPQTGTCLRATAGAVAVHSSAQFSSDSGLSGGQISSQTTSFRSSAAARRALVALRSQRVPHCLQPAIRSYLRPAALQSDLKLEPGVQITPLPIAVTGHPSAFAYRLAITAQPRAVSQQQFSVYVDLSGFQTGPILTELITISTGQPGSTNVEQHLLDLLARRAHRDLPSPS